MKYRRTDRFKKAYDDLPETIKKKVVKAFRLFQENPSHPSLGVKKMQGVGEIWEGRIDDNYRFTFHYEDNGGDQICVFRVIGTHDILNQP